MEALTIRKAVLQDTDAAYAVIRQCRDALSEQGMDNWNRYNRTKVEQIVRSDEMFILVTGSEAIGTVKISEQAPLFFNDQDMARWENAAAQAFYITALAIAPAHQGKGYGTVMLNFAERYALNHGIGYLRMTMFSENVSLGNYYLRRGFSFPQTRKVSELGITLAFGEKRLNG